MVNYKHVVFDVDGTLIDTADCILYSMKQMLETVMGVSYEIHELEFALSNPSVRNLQILKMEEEKIPGAVKMWVDNEEENLDMIRTFDGIPELLERLKEEGCTLGIVTSRTHGEFDLVFDKLPIKKYFSFEVCADDTQEHKPSGQPLQKYMEMAGAIPEEVIYIGDSASDMKCAANAGAASAFAVWGARNKDAKADFYLETVQGLEKVLFS